ncbi:MAG TPA: DUF4178 domain-containing protein [Candidatus Solibacter sp.]|nr:DUF4178 domain-containing protein [Candidatus Solibacter sp.]
MTERTSFCPNCGAPIAFRWSSSVQTVCTFCKSILVRTDVDIKKVGQVADLPPDASPIQINTEGTYGNRSFVVVGRIIYQYDQGGWNEWHIVFNDGSDGWLSDAQDEYMISFAKDIQNLPSQKDARLGMNYQWNGIPFTVTSRTLAHYAGVEGELPFQYWDKHEVVFVDLRSHASDFATLDYSDEKPVLYLGKAVDFDDLRLMNTRKFESW